MKTFVVFFVVAFVACAASESSDDEFFKSWMKKHDKNYVSKADEDVAKENVLRNKADCDAHNKLYDEGKVSYTLDVWKHSDLSEADQNEFLHGHDDTPESEDDPEEDDEQTRSTRATRHSHHKKEFKAGPDSIDWREKGLVGSVRDQGHCGSCWSFSVSGVIEAAFRKKNITADVAPQMLIDCMHKGNRGCE